MLEYSLIGEGIGVPGSLAPHPGVGLVLEEGIQTFGEPGLGRGEILGTGEVVKLMWVFGHVIEFLGRTPPKQRR